MSDLLQKLKGLNEAERKAAYEALKLDNEKQERIEAEIARGHPLMTAMNNEELKSAELRLNAARKDLAAAS